MAKKIMLAFCVLAVAAFGFDWGIYGGPGAAVTFTNMGPVQSALSRYDIPTIAHYQVGLAVPVVLRLWNFTIGGGDSYSWQTASGTDYKATLHHNINQAEFGYIIDLSDHLRLRPVIGIGDYSIDLRIAEISGGFGDSDDADGESYSYDYENFSLTAGVGLSYYWKFESRLIVGLEAKARYLVPLQMNPAWEAESSDYVDVYIDDFYPHTPTVSLGFFIGYEHLDKDREMIEKDWEEWEEK
jgi:hypothetical protein